MADLTIYLHRDFDGVASAALVLRWLRGQHDLEKTRLTSVNYGEPWEDIRLSQPCAVVDFLYHPDSAYFWDHHGSSFLSAEWERDFRARRDRGEPVWCDPAEPSCASLIARTIPSLDGRGVRDLVNWSIVIDAAKYKSVEQVFASEEPALRINLALADAPESFFVEVARGLAAESLEEVAALPDVQHRFATAHEVQLRELDYFGPHVRCEEGIVSADVTDEVLRFSRYSPYYFARDALYSVVLYREATRFKVLCMRNPWVEFESMDLGALCQRSGGGGHWRVGAAAFPLSEKTRAEAVLEELRTIVARHATSVQEVISEPV